ncbi:IS5/IS1182 family transposase [Streptomyces sp. NRRL B-24085]|uniref:IS5/IS1182 family transposase n=1 Tax=Streptomyces sp. NRRL B-24085 TaxID=1709476 RepID=UPI0007C7DCC7|nr:IS5/IS1182 family transposase [Streptomyces sp. NRRL B-24085]
MADTRGLVMVVMVTPADVQDRDAAEEILFRMHLMHPEIATARADPGYAGPLVTWAKDRLHITSKTVGRPPHTPGLIVLFRSWAVARSLSWIMRARRRCRSHEPLPQVRESLITWASITVMTPEPETGATAAADTIGPGGCRCLTAKIHLATVTPVIPRPPVTRPLSRFRPRPVRSLTGRGGPSGMGQGRVGPAAVTRPSPPGATRL